MRRLARTVYLEDDDGQIHGFGPADQVPDWAAAKVTNPNVWEDVADEVDDQEAATAPAEAGEPTIDLIEVLRALGASDDDIDIIEGYTDDQRAEFADDLAAQIAELTSLDDEQRAQLAELVVEIEVALEGVSPEDLEILEHLDDDERAELAALVDQAAGATPALEEPPRGGAGSGRDAWAAYAAALEINVTEDDDRDQIIAKVDALKA